MRSILNWTNLYGCRDGTWYRGNFHTHTNLSDGEMTPEAVIDLYREMGYDYLGITDHNKKSTPGLQDRAITQLAGIEMDSQDKYHIGIIHSNAECIVDDPDRSSQEIIDRNIENGCLVVLNHPNWTIDEHLTFENLRSLKNYSGIEIYNRVVERTKGAALATFKWDRLLSAGQRVLGFATQDLHRRVDFEDCCTVVRSSGPDAPSLLEALKSGNSYCYYGVNIEDLGREGGTVFISTENARLIRFVGSGGMILKEIEGREGEITFTDDPEMDYIRIECLGCGKETSWSQPFFRS